MKLPFALDRLPAELQPQAAPGTCESVIAAVPEPVDFGPEDRLALNCGAGRGGLSALLSAASFTVESVDLHAEHFRAPGLSCQCADLNKPLPFPDASFSVVVAVEVIEHLENPWGFVREALRVLREDGVLVVTSPNVVSWPARLAFLRAGILPYFRIESFVGCYHVTPIFPWALERCLSTTDGVLESTSYSRNDWPRPDDVPRFDDGRGWRRKLLNTLGNSWRFGEIAIYRIRKARRASKAAIGVHYA